MVAQCTGPTSLPNTNSRSCIRVVVKIEPLTSSLVIFARNQLLIKVKMTPAVMDTLEATVDLKPFLLDVKRYLDWQEIRNDDICLYRNLRQAANSFFVWNDEVSPRTRLRAKLVVPRTIWEHVIKMFHDNIGDWDETTNRRFVIDRFWWPKVSKEMFSNVNSSTGWQKATLIPKYQTSLRMPITGLFHTFSIDIAGPLPSGADEECYTLVAVEHLMSRQLVCATVTDTAKAVVKFVNEDTVSSTHLDGRAPSSLKMARPSLRSMLIISCLPRESVEKTLQNTPQCLMAVLRGW